MGLFRDWARKRNLKKGQELLRQAIDSEDFQKADIIIKEYQLEQKIVHDVMYQRYCTTMQIGDAALPGSSDVQIQSARYLRAFHIAQHFGDKSLAKGAFQGCLESMLVKDGREVYNCELTDNAIIDIWSRCLAYFFPGSGGDAYKFFLIDPSTSINDIILRDIFLFQEPIRRARKRLAVIKRVQHAISGLAPKAAANCVLALELTEVNNVIDIDIVFNPKGVEWLSKDPRTNKSTIQQFWDSLEDQMAQIFRIALQREVVGLTSLDSINSIEIHAFHGIKDFTGQVQYRRVFKVFIEEDNTLKLADLEGSDIQRIKSNWKISWKEPNLTIAMGNW